MKTYVITVSEYFPVTHPKKGQPTGFVDKILSGEKLHTIRANYDLWAKRFAKIQNGEACLSLRVWTGLPYRSKQKEIKRFYSDSSHVGIEKLVLDTFLGWFIDDVDSDFTRKDFAPNDGLSLPDFNSWFKKLKKEEEYAIIHFTNFRYKK